MVNTRFFHSVSSESVGRKTLKSELYLQALALFWPARVCIGIDSVGPAKALAQPTNLEGKVRTTWALAGPAL